MSVKRSFTATNVVWKNQGSYWANYGTANEGDVSAEPSSPSPKRKIRIKKSSGGGDAKFVQKKSNRNSEDSDEFVTVSYGTDEFNENAEMEDRLKDAQQWVSKQLSDEEAKLLNRAMGIEEEVLNALGSEDDNISSGMKNKKVKLIDNAIKKGKRGRLVDQLQDERLDRAELKGFLELNPYICSGCGSPFQSKSEDTPGFLPKEKFVEHRNNAELIKAKQDALRVLEMAGIEPGSKAAEELLIEANVPKDVIEGVKAFSSPSSAKKEMDSLKLFVADDESNDDLEQVNMDLFTFTDDDPYENGDFDDEDEDEEVGIRTENKDDTLDGLELDLEDLLAAFGDDKNDSKDAGSAFISEISKAASKKSNFNSSEFGSDNSNYVNDIDSEINPFGSKKMKNVEYSDHGSAVAFANFDDEEFQKSLKKDYSRFKNTKNGITTKNSNQMQNEKSVCICQRCFRLQQYGQVEQSLRPGWSDHELLTPEHFVNLLSNIKEQKAVVLCIVDVFDLEGSILKNLRSIAGPNPVVIAANKADLIPKDASDVRMTNWIHSEIKYMCDMKSPKEAEESNRKEMEERGWIRPKAIADESGILRRQNIHLVSCATGMGMKKLMNSVVAMAGDNGNKVYVMGAANVGKSSFINQLLEVSRGNKSSKKVQKKKSNVPQATVSNLPGTTLNFLKIKLPNGITMIDTPGLLNEGQLTAKLSTEELRMVIPSTPVVPVTFRVAEGKCVLIGGLAKVEMTEVSEKLLLLLFFWLFL